jgi:peptide/nickel transport system substrate-binding protein
MADHRPFAMNRRRFVKSLAGISAAVPLLRAPAIASAAALLTAPARVAAQTAIVFIDARTTEAAGLDPHNVPALANFRVTHLMYEGLVWLDENLNIQPMLAESWEIPNSTTYAFHIRQGVKFHNGGDLTADDVKATVERILDEATGSQYRGDLLPVDSVEVVDKYIAQFNLKTPYSGLLAALSNVLIVPKEVKSRPLDYLKNQEIGTGPWTLDSWNPNVEMKLVKFPGYWAQVPTNITNVTIRIMPEESSIIAALRTGEVHHAVLEDNKNYALVNTNPTLQTWRTPALGTNVININHRKDPLSKIGVRQAMSMAIDRDEILQAAGSGFGSVSGPIPSSHPLWTVPIANLPFYKPDPDGAKAALASAGYPNGFDMDIIYIPQFPLMDISAQVLAAQWQKIGINASPRATEYGVWLDLRVKTFDYWISTNLDFPTLDPDQYLYNTFHTGSSPAAWDNWSDPEVDALLEQGRATTDQAMRQQIYTQAQQMLCNKVAAFWSYAAEHVDVANQKLLNFKPHPTTMLFGLVNSTLAA